MEVVHKQVEETIEKVKENKEVPPKIQPVFGRFTNQDLLNFNNTILELRGNVLYWFLRGKINEFHKQNNVRFQSLADKVQELQHIHFEFDGDKVKTIKNEEGVESVVCNEGFTMTDYDKAYQSLMEQDCPIEI